MSFHQLLHTTGLHPHHRGSSTFERLLSDSFDPASFVQQVLGTDNEEGAFAGAGLQSHQSQAAQARDILFLLQAAGSEGDVAGGSGSGALMPSARLGAGDDDICERALAAASSQAAAIEAAIKEVVLRHQDELLSTAGGSKGLIKSLDSAEQRIGGLKTAYSHLQEELLEPYAELQRDTALLGKIVASADVLRKVQTCLGSLRKLQQQLGGAGAGAGGGSGGGSRNSSEGGEHLHTLLRGEPQGLPSRTFSCDAGSLRDLRFLQRLVPALVEVEQQLMGRGAGSTAKASSTSTSSPSASHGKGLTPAQPPASSLEAVALLQSYRPGLQQLGDAVRAALEQALRRALYTVNAAEAATVLQLAQQLGELTAVVEAASSAFSAAAAAAVKEALSIQAVAEAALASIQGEPLPVSFSSHAMVAAGLAATPSPSSSSASGYGSAGGMTMRAGSSAAYPSSHSASGSSGAPPAALVPAAGAAAAWRGMLWARMESLADELHNSCLRSWTLGFVLEATQCAAAGGKGEGRLSDFLTQDLAPVLHSSASSSSSSSSSSASSSGASGGDSKGSKPSRSCSGSAAVVALCSRHWESLTSALHSSLSQAVIESPFLRDSLSEGYPRMHYLWLQLLLKTAQSALLRSGRDVAGLQGSLQKVQGAAGAFLQWLEGVASSSSPSSLVLPLHCPAVSPLDGPTLFHLSFPAGPLLDSLLPIRTVFLTHSLSRLNDQVALMFAGSAGLAVRAAAGGGDKGPKRTGAAGAAVGGPPASSGSSSSSSSSAPPFSSSPFVSQSQYDALMDQQQPEPPSMQATSAYCKALQAEMLLASPPAVSALSDGSLAASVGPLLRGVRYSGGPEEGLLAQVCKGVLTSVKVLSAKAETLLATGPAATALLAAHCISTAAQRLNAAVVARLEEVRKALLRLLAEQLPAGLPRGSLQLLGQALMQVKGLTGAGQTTGALLAGAGGAARGLAAGQQGFQQAGSAGTGAGAGAGGQELELLLQELAGKSTVPSSPAVAAVAAALQAAVCERYPLSLPLPHHCLLAFLLSRPEQERQQLLKAAGFHAEVSIGAGLGGSSSGTGKNQLLFQLRSLLSAASRIERREQQQQELRSSSSSSNTPFELSANGRLLSCLDRLDAVIEAALSPWLASIASGLEETLCAGMKEVPYTGMLPLLVTSSSSSSSSSSLPGDASSSASPAVSINSDVLLRPSDYLRSLLPLLERVTAQQLSLLPLGHLSTACKLSMAGFLLHCFTGMLASLRPIDAGGVLRLLADSEHLKDGLLPLLHGTAPSAAAAGTGAGAGITAGTGNGAAAFSAAGLLSRGGVLGAAGGVAGSSTGARAPTETGALPPSKAFMQTVLQLLSSSQGGEEQYQQLSLSPAAATALLPLLQKLQSNSARAEQLLQSGGPALAAQLRQLQALLLSAAAPSSSLQQALKAGEGSAVATAAAAAAAAAGTSLTLPCQQAVDAAVGELMRGPYSSRSSALLLQLLLSRLPASLTTLPLSRLGCSSPQEWLFWMDAAQLLQYYSSVSAASTAGSVGGLPACISAGLQQVMQGAAEGGKTAAAGAPAAALSAQDLLKLSQRSSSSSAAAASGGAASGGSAKPWPLLFARLALSSSLAAEAAVASVQLSSFGAGSSSALTAAGAEDSPAAASAGLLASVLTEVEGSLQEYRDRAEAVKAAAGGGAGGGAGSSTLAKLAAQTGTVQALEAAISTAKSGRLWG